MQTYMTILLRETKKEGEVSRSFKRCFDMFLLIMSQQGETNIGLRGEVKKKMQTAQVYTGLI